MAKDKSFLEKIFGDTNKKTIKKSQEKKSTKGQRPIAPVDKVKPIKKPVEITPLEKAENEALDREIDEELKKDERGLSPRELRFIKYHLLTLTKESAAIQAGYSEKSAGAIASRLLKRPAVKKELDKRIKSLVSRTDEKIAKVIEHLYISAFYDPKDILDENGDFIKPLAEMGNLSYAVEGIETKLNAKGDSYKLIKLANRTKAREQLGKYLQMFTDKVELTGGLTLTIGKPPEPVKTETEEKQ